MVKTIYDNMSVEEKTEWMKAVKSLEGTLKIFMGLGGADMLQGNKARMLKEVKRRIVWAQESVKNYEMLKTKHDLGRFENL